MNIPRKYGNAPELKKHKMDLRGIVYFTKLSSVTGFGFLEAESTIFFQTLSAVTFLQKKISKSWQMRQIK